MMSNYQESRHEVPLVPLSNGQERQQKPCPDDDLPTNICQESQLSLVPKECLSIDDEERPLRQVDDLGNVYHLSLIHT